MKFSDVEQSSWEGLRPYVDTCLLPVTGLTGAEQPWEATQALEQLRDALDCFEIPYKGRVITYPAFHYTDDQRSGELLKQICDRLKQSGFRYIVLISARIDLEAMPVKTEADLAFTLSPSLLADSLPEVKRHISDKLRHLWLNEK